MSSTNDPMASALGGLLSALLNGAAQAQSQPQPTTQSTDRVLGSTSKSETPTRTQSAPAMDDVLGSLLGGGAPATSSRGGEDALGSLLGSLLGSGTLAGSSSNYPSQQMPSAGTDQLGSLLSGLLGVDTSGGARVVANNPISNAFVVPIADALARKTGMAPGIAQVVVVFAINVLLAGVAQQGSRQQLSREELITKLQNGEPITQTYLKESGLLSQLVQETGLSQKTAAQSLQQVFRALGTQMSEGTPEERQQELQTFLRKWK